MLTDYKGPSNSSEIFQYLVGEKITAAFKIDNKIYLVLESGQAIVFGGRDSSPSYWKEAEMELSRTVKERAREIKRKIAELRDLPGVKLP